MSPTSAGGGTNTKTGGEHISRLVETPRGSFAYGKTGTTALYCRRNEYMELLDINTLAFLLFFG